MTKRLLVVLTVLLVHTAAAHAQQSPVMQDPGTTAAEAYPPAYAPPPGFSPPAGPPPTYGAAPSYGPPPTYGPPAYRAAPPYAGPPGRYAPPSYYYYPPPAAPPRQVTDRPFTLGGGIGFGGLTFKDPATGRIIANSGMAYTFRLGFGLRPGLILMWDVEGALVNNGTTATAQTANLAALQVFATRRLFLKAGFGLAQVVQNDTPSVWGGAGMAGIGYELVQGWNWSLDMEATYTGARYTNNGADQTWANWSLVNFAINFF